MKRKLTGSATGAAALFIISGFLATGLGVRQFDRIMTEPVWVVSNELRAGDAITRNTLVQTRIAKGEAAAVVNDPRQLIGQTLAVDKALGEPITAGDLKRQKKKSLSDMIPQGRVLYSLTPKPGGIPYSQLHGGDRLDVLVRGSGGVRAAALDARLIAVQKPNAAKALQSETMKVLQNNARADVNPDQSTTLIVAVRPGDVYPLASIGAREVTSVVLHSAQDTANGTSPNVRPSSRYHEVEIVTGLNRNKVRVQR